jgi:hypothetical protein
MNERAVDKPLYLTFHLSLFNCLVSLFANEQGERKEGGGAGEGVGERDTLNGQGDKTSSR